MARPVSAMFGMLTPRHRKEFERKLAERHLTYDQLSDWLKARGYRVRREAIWRYASATGHRRARPNVFLRIDRILSPEDRVAYEALIGDPRTTNEAALAWLKEHGYSASDSAVARHRRRFIDMLDNVRESARVASEIVQITRVPGAAQLSEGMLAKMEQVILEQLVRLKERGRIHPKDLSELTKSVSQAVNTRETLEAIRREFEQEKRKAAEAGEAAVKSGATGKDVVVRMREILGV
jgi:hypothetical protein